MLFRSETNSRQPAELMGDIEAQLGGCFLGRDFVANLAGKYGLETYQRAIEIILDQSEAAARARIAAMPDGVYDYETFLDDDTEGRAVSTTKCAAWRYRGSRSRYRSRNRRKGSAT